MKELRSDRGQQLGRNPTIAKRIGHVCPTSSFFANSNMIPPRETRNNVSIHIRIGTAIRASNVDVCRRAYLRGRCIRGRLS